MIIRLDGENGVVRNVSIKINKNKNESNQKTEKKIMKGNNFIIILLRFEKH